MSGGHWDYLQYRFTDVVEDIKKEIEKSGKLKTQEELKEEFYRDSDWYEKYPEDLNHYKYPENVLAEFKNAVKHLRVAEIYAQRVDWLLSGDDGEDTFIEKLKSDLAKIENPNYDNMFTVTE